MMKERPPIWHLRNNMQQSVRGKEILCTVLFRRRDIAVLQCLSFSELGKGQDVYETSSAKGF